MWPLDEDRRLLIAPLTASLFLVAPKQLYKSACPSVRPYVMLSLAATYAVYTALLTNGWLEGEEVKKESEKLALGGRGRR